MEIGELEVPEASRRMVQRHPQHLVVDDGLRAIAAPIVAASYRQASDRLAAEQLMEHGEGIRLARELLRDWADELDGQISNGGAQ